jgi:hypothetical protein
MADQARLRKAAVTVVSAAVLLEVGHPHDWLLDAHLPESQVVDIGGPTRPVAVSSNTTLLPSVAAYRDFG